MKYTLTPLPHILDVFRLKADQVMLHETIQCSKSVWNRCQSTFHELIYGYWRRYCIFIIFHPAANTFSLLPSSIPWHIEDVYQHLCIQSVSSNRHQCPLPAFLIILQRVHRSLLLNPSVKFIAILTTEVWILWTLILLPISILQKKFPYIHSPSYSSILSCCIHVQVQTTIVKITLAHIQVPITFLNVFTLSVSVLKPSPDVYIIIICILRCLHIISCYPLPIYRFQNISECILVQTQTLLCNAHSGHSTSIRRYPQTIYSCQDTV